MTNKELQTLLSNFPDNSIVKIVCDDVARNLKNEAVIRGDTLFVVADRGGNPYQTFGRRTDAPEPVVTQERLEQAKQTISQYTKAKNKEAAGHITGDFSLICFL